MDSAIGGVIGNETAVTGGVGPVAGSPPQTRRTVTMRAMDADGRTDAARGETTCPPLGRSEAVAGEKPMAVDMSARAPRSAATVLGARSSAVRSGQGAPITREMGAAERLRGAAPSHGKQERPT